VATGPRDGDGEKGTPARQPGHPGTDHGDAGSPVYFTDPYSAWQKGSIENANKLIRQYIPKGASFKDYPPDRLKRIQHRLNERPRKKLDFNTPKVEFYKQLM
jgi:IS30 family transposase